MSLYDSLAATALQLLKDKGQPVTLRFAPIGAYDPTTSATPGTTTDATVMAAILDFPPGQSLERGTLIQGGDKRALMGTRDASGNAVVPDLTCNMVVGGMTYKVLTIGEVNPGGTPVLYKLHLRT